MLGLAGCDRSCGGRDRDRSENRRRNCQRCRAANLARSSGDRGRSRSDALCQSRMQTDGCNGRARRSPARRCGQVLRRAVAISSRGCKLLSLRGNHRRTAGSDGYRFENGRSSGPGQRYQLRTRKTAIGHSQRSVSTALGTGCESD